MIVGGRRKLSGRQGRFVRFRTLLETVREGRYCYEHVFAHCIDRRHSSG
jgi:hypothetical protein